jgi:hypothetical protein
VADRPTFEDVQRNTDFSRSILLQNEDGTAIGGLGTTGTITSVVFRAKNDLDDPGLPEVVADITSQQTDPDLAADRILIGLTSSELDILAGTYQWQVEIQGGTKPGRYPLVAGLMYVIPIVE